MKWLFFSGYTWVRLSRYDNETYGWHRFPPVKTCQKKNVMFLLGISENKATRKEFAIYRSNVVVPTGPGFFSLKTFCFAKMTSRVFNIVLEGSFQRSCYEPGSTMLKKRDVIEAKLKVWGDKKACAFGTTLLRKQNSPRHIIFRNSMQNIIFLSLEKVFQN